MWNSYNIIEALLNTMAFLIMAFLAFCVFIVVREYCLKIKKVIKEGKGNAKIEVMINLTKNEIHEVKAAVSSEIKRLEVFSATHKDSSNSNYKRFAERSSASISVLKSAYDKLGVE